MMTYREIAKPEIKLTSRTGLFNEEKQRVEGIMNDLQAVFLSDHP